VSGKEVRTITDYFGGIRGLGLAAEHGFYYLWPQNDLASSGPEKAKWQTAMESVDDGWKASAKMVMDIFVQRTHGTYIEQKGNTLIWQYSDADPEFGFLQSKELEGHLKLIMANYRVEVLRGGGVADGYIEVRPLGASKGLFLDHSISTMRASNQEADFILAIGDDSSDEPMFERISLLTQEQSAQLHAYSVTVGKKPTEAKAYLDDPSGVLELLQSISKYSNRDRKFFSVVDLPSQAQSDISGMSSKSAKRVGFEQTTQKTGGLTRASSASQIFGLTTEPSHKATNESATARAKTTAMGQPAGVVGTLRPIASVSQISASEYLSSINDVNDEEDEGIFF
jgi:trehalose 6-phosphate synthase/phosphatase